MKFVDEVRSEDANENCQCHVETCSGRCQTNNQKRI